MSKMGRPVGSGNIPLSIRFMTKVNKTSDGSCWEWLGAKDQNGYGSIQAFRDLNTGKWVLKNATHVSWWYFTGEWPTQWMLHTCDNPSCVNPDHLFEGDVTDNNRDMIAKGRGPQYNKK